MKLDGFYWKSVVVPQLFLEDALLLLLPGLQQNPGTSLRTQKTTDFLTRL